MNYSGWQTVILQNLSFKLGCEFQNDHQHSIILFKFPILGSIKYEGDIGSFRTTQAYAISAYHH